MPRMKQSLPPSVAEQLSQARAILERHLNGNILAIHLFGSAVDGGLKPHSDLDLLVTVREPPTDATRHALMKELLTASAPPGAQDHVRPLEVTVITHSEVVPWRYPPKRELQFGEWLRASLENNVFEPPMVDHDLAILLTKARQNSVSLQGPAATNLFDSVPRTHLVQSLRDTVAQWNEPTDWAGDERNIVLALARIWYTAVTGEIASKDAAALWLLHRLQGSNRAVVSKARAAYLGEQHDDLARQPTEVATFILHARQEIERLCGGPE